MLPEGIHSFETLRPMFPEPPRPMTNEPVSVHVLEGEQTVLFGTGFEADVDRLIDFLDGFGGPDVIVVEHTDPDHYGALPRLLEEYDAIVAVPKQEADVLREKGIKVDVELGHDEVRWGVRTIHIPGHTPGNMSFLHEETGTLFVGDTFVHHNSFAAAPGEWSGAFAPIKPSLNADNDLALENIKILADYDFDVALTTHGLNVKEGARAELDKLLSDLGLA
ncbi:MULTISPECIES: MBL fold metallo-hydrolase [unclassified Haladaptatus]|uniref:MBL fold metallo-hydrolase n=1 Tax=unclassified Haladaptatus TaxID=2622732 RepID=UPI002FCE280E